MKYESCLRVAQHKQISYSRSDLASTLLERVWADFKAPLLDKSIDGFRFFIIFVDEKSWYTTVYPLLQKGDAYSAFLVYEAPSERVTGREGESKPLGKR